MLAIANVTSKFDKTNRKHTRWALLIGNALLLLVVSFFVIANRSASQTIRSSTLNSPVATAQSISHPLDQLSSEQIALQAAKMAKLPELPIISNRADSVVALLSVAPNDATVLAKPQVVSTAQKSRFDITSYRTQQNDSITHLALKYGVSANSIKWSNNLTTDILNPGLNLYIPPGDGIVYRFKSGDSISGLAAKYQVNKDTLIQVNDAELGLKPGTLLWIPNGLQPAQTTFTPSTLGFGGFTSGGGRRFNSCSLGIDNSYFCGWCTWWAAYRRSQIGRPVPTGLGDAYTWRYGSNFVVRKTPHAGDVIWFPFNHVGFVEKVNSDGSIRISEMNHEGWDVVNYRDFPADQLGSYLFLY